MLCLHKPSTCRASARLHTCVRCLYDVFNGIIGYLDLVCHSWKTVPFTTSSSTFAEWANKLMTNTWQYYICNLLEWIIHCPRRPRYPWKSLKRFSENFSNCSKSNRFKSTPDWLHIVADRNGTDFFRDGVDLKSCCSRGSNYKLHWRVLSATRYIRSLSNKILALRSRFSCFYGFFKKFYLFPRVNPTWKNHHQTNNRPDTK
jgi:hypothetical protein